MSGPVADNHQAEKQKMRNGEGQALWWLYMVLKAFSSIGVPCLPVYTRRASCAIGRTTGLEGTLTGSTAYGPFKWDLHNRFKNEGASMVIMPPLDAPGPGESAQKSPV